MLLEKTKMKEPRWKSNRLFRMNVLAVFRNWRARNGVKLRNWDDVSAIRRFRERR